MNFYKLKRCFNYIPLLIVFISYASCTPAIKTTSDNIIIVSDDFEKGLDTNLWHAEIAPQPNSSVYTKQGKLVLDTKGGVTVWLKKKLQSNCKIEFTRTVVLDSGINDRLSDLNVFWMAIDPLNQNLFTRNGVLESYDSLQLYYVGMGGNTNSTTRFRKYQGTGERTLLQEYTQPEFLLQPNKEYKITIVVKNKNTSFAVDGKTIFTYDDPAILKEGFFGFRSTKSRQTIDNFRVYKL